MDKQGKIFGKLSIIDLIIVIVTIGLCVSLVTKLSSKNIKSIVAADTKFYTTFKVDKVRQYSVDAVKVGDIVFENHAQKIGKVVAIKSEPAFEIMKRNDGTAEYVPMEGRFALYITLECTGNVNEKGYFINGNRQVSSGATVDLKSNMISTSSKVYSIDSTLQN